VPDPARYRTEIARLRKLLQFGGDVLIPTNIAAIYRMAGNRRRAFEWWQRAAAVQDDGSASLELGYCFQYAIGVRRDELAACKAYRAAVRSQWIDDYSRQEALYHLAVAYLDIDNGQRGRCRAAKLLREATADGDYPQAADLLDRLERDGPLSVCRCRRGLRRSLGGKAQCALHERVWR
jgi:tetratricopeptide (TPR) repeat protein